VGLYAALRLRHPRPAERPPSIPRARRDDEVLLDDSRRYVERAVAADVDAELDVWMGMPHGSVTGIREFAADRQALNAIGAFLSERLL